MARTIATRGAGTRGATRGRRIKAWGMTTAAVVTPANRSWRSHSAGKTGQPLQDGQVSAKSAGWIRLLHPQ
jgi:hypothetical protein